MIAKYLVSYRSGNNVGTTWHITRTHGRYKLRKPKPDLKSIANFLREEYGDDCVIISISEIE